MNDIALHAGCYPTWKLGNLGDATVTSMKQSIEILLLIKYVLIQYDIRLRDEQVWLSSSISYSRSSAIA